MDMQYLPQISKEADFDEFWAKTLRESDAQPLEPRFEQLSYDPDTVCLKRVYFNAFGGGRIDGIYITPKNAAKPMPAIIFTHGYSMCIHHVSHYLKWILAGFAVLALNMRVEIPMRSEDTPSHRVPGGIMTRGIESPQTYIFRYMYADMYRAVGLLRTLPEIDGTRIGLWGASQGGGLALAAAALDGNVRFVAALYPFMNNLPYAFENRAEGPHQELWRYCRLYDPEMAHVSDIMRTLSYFDILNFTDRIKGTVLIAAGLRDTCCLPQATVGLYNRLTCEKQLKLYHTHAHEDIWNYEEYSYHFALESVK